MKTTNNLTTLNDDLNQAIKQAIASRPGPFRASFHGDSAIILDASGQWVTGQVPRNDANQLAASMTGAQQKGQS